MFVQGKDNMCVLCADRLKDKMSELEYIRACMEILATTKDPEEHEHVKKLYAKHIENKLNILKDE